MGKDPLGNSIKCAFGFTLRSQNTRFQVENPKSMFGNEMQMRILEKPIFQVQKTCTFLCGSQARVFAKSHNTLSILPLEAIMNFPNWPLCFKRKITLSIVLSSRTRSHLSATVDTAKMNYILILDENHGVIDQYNNEKAASNGGAKAGLDS